MTTCPEPSAMARMLAPDNRVRFRIRGWTEEGRRRDLMVSPRKVFRVEWSGGAGLRADHDRAGVGTRREARQRERAVAACTRPRRDAVAVDRRRGSAGDD